MNSSPVADALRFAVTQTVRALTQPGGIQALATELRQQNQPQSTLGNNRSSASGTPNQTPASAAVELSPAARLPPVDAAQNLAATRGALATPLTIALLELPMQLADTRPGEPGYANEALRLAAQLKMHAEPPPVATQPIAALLRSVSSMAATANYEAMQPGTPARKRDEARPLLRGLIEQDLPRDASVQSEATPPGDPRAAAFARQATQDGDARESNPQPAGASPSPTTTQILQRPDLAYQRVAPRPETTVRLDIYRFGERAPSADGSAVETLGATIYLQLPTIGEVVITMAITGHAVDLAVAAPANALDALRDGSADMVSAAGAWGVKVRGVSFVPFDKPRGTA